MSKLRSLLLAAAVSAGLSVPATAGEVVLVELFTSQGCSSCPPADQLLGELAERSDVLPLSMHVDYWDYLGWRDTFARREFVERQYAYREQMGARVVYTPQMVIQGRHDAVGARVREVMGAIETARAEREGARIRLAESGGMLTAALVPAGHEADCTVWVAKYRRAAEVEIEHGENSGRTITYHNVVDSLMRVGAWQGRAERTISLPQPDKGEGIAVWVQDDGTGRVLAANFLNR